MGFYKPVSERAIALYGDADVELDLSPADEADALQGGHLSIVPRHYKVLVNNFADGKQGSTVDLALTVENAAALIAGGFLEPVTASKSKPTK